MKLCFGTCQISYNVAWKKAEVKKKTQPNKNFSCEMESSNILFLKHSNALSYHCINNAMFYNIYKMHTLPKCVTQLTIFEEREPSPYTGRHYICKCVL